MKISGAVAIIKFTILLVVVVSAFLFADYVPYSVRSFSYALSLTVKEILVFLLPFIVFSIIFRSVSKMRGGTALKTVLLLLTMIVLSNSVSIFIAHAVGRFTASTLSNNFFSTNMDATSSNLVPYFTFKLPRVISTMKAVFLGFFAGMILPKITEKKSEKLACVLASASMFFLERIFTPVLPIFILGLVFQMQSANVLDTLVSNSEVALYIFGSAIVHVFVLYLLATGFYMRRALLRMKDMLPAVLFALTSLSSLLGMPIVLKAVKKETPQEDHVVIDLAIPTSLNVHLIGDCFFIVAIAIVISYTFSEAGYVPLHDYIYFLLYFLVLKFAVVAIPGGGIISMLPIIEQYLHYTPTMLSLIMMLYVIFDPFITAVNVLGNGAFTRLFIRVHNTLLSEKKGSHSGR